MKKKEKKAEWKNIKMSKNHSKLHKQNLKLS